MYEFIFPEKDTFISNHPKLLNRNFGIDEVLEIGKRTTSQGQTFISRALIKFDTTEVSKSIASGNIKKPKFFLHLNTVDAFELPLEYSITGHPVSQSWEMGTGRLFDDGTIKGASWQYRTENNVDPWDVGVENSASNAGGGTWLNLMPSQSLTYANNGLPFSGIEQGQFTCITSSLGEVYCFAPSASSELSQLGNATASVCITAINNFDQFTISGSKLCNFIAINNNTPEDCGDNIYFSFGSTTADPIESTGSLTFETEIPSGTQYEISGDETYTFVASSNPNVSAPECSNFKFFDVTGDMVDNVTSMSIAINSVDDLCVTASAIHTYSSSISASVTQSFTSSVLTMNSVDAGEGGNMYYVWDVSDNTSTTSVDACGKEVVTVTGNKSYFTNGQNVGLKTRFEALVNAMSGSDCGVTFNTSSGFCLNFTASVSGTAGNSYYFQSGSTTTTFGGATNSSSFAVLEDDPNNYFYLTGSTLPDSLSNLSVKINDTVDFVSSSVSGSTLVLTSTTVGQESETISFQSGSTQVSLLNGSATTNITASVSQSFKYQTSDLNMDITDIVYAWINKSIPNHGIILRHSEEEGPVHFGALKYFAQDTNTIYIPRISVRHDDSVRNDTIDPVSGYELIVTSTGLKKQYSAGERVRINIFARDEYPTKTFQNQATRYTSTKLLPATTYYAIQDAESEEFLIDYDTDFTKLSSDSNGNYFMLDTTHFPQERYFRLYIKVVRGDSMEIFKDNTVFKVTV